MNANQTPVLIGLVVATVILLFAGFMAVSSVNNNLKLVADGLNDINVPSAKDIADLVVIPEMPEYEVPEESQTLLCGLYDFECGELEIDVQIAMWDEYDDEYMDEIRDLIEDNEGEDIINLSITDWNYRDDYDFNVINLGLDDSEDRAGEFEVTFRVSYELEDDPEHTLYDKVYVTGTASDWDDRDKEFDTVEAEFTL